MTKIGLFYGSEEGNTERVAYKIQQRFGADIVDVHDIADATQLHFVEYNYIILGISTWDFGQIQSDWEDFWGDIEAVDFSGKTVAFFGLGDQFGYAEYFLDAMGMLHDVIAKTASKIIGQWPIQGYEFEASKARIPHTDCFVGLALDEDHQEYLTSSRVNQWCVQIHKEFGLQTPLTSFNH